MPAIFTGIIDINVIRLQNRKKYQTLERVYVASLALGIIVVWLSLHCTTLFSKNLLFFVIIYKMRFIRF